MENNLTLQEELSLEILRCHGFPVEKFCDIGIALPENCQKENKLAICINCWTELEIEPVVNAKIIRAYKLITELYETEGGGCGGVGHIVFDDWNVEDASIDYCLERCDAEELVRVIGADAIEASRAALLYFHILTEDERYTALAFHGKELDIFQFVECL